MAHLTKKEAIHYRCMRLVTIDDGSKLNTNEPNTEHLRSRLPSDIECLMLFIAIPKKHLKIKLEEKRGILILLVPQGKIFHMTNEV